MNSNNGEKIICNVLKHVKILLDVTGFWPSANDNLQKNHHDKIKGYFFSICALSLAIIQCFFMIFNYTNPIIFIRNSAEALPSLTGCLRVVMFMKNRNYLAFIVETILLVVTTIGLALVETYTIFFISCLCGELECITMKIMKINKQSNSLFIKNIFYQHVNALALGDEICKFISFIVCVQYCATMIALCCSAFTAFLLLDVLITAKAVIITFVLLCQIFVICFIGETVSKSSASVTDAINNSNWHILGNKNCKIILFMLLRSQKTLRLHFAAMPVMNLQTFNGFVSAIFSYMTVMNKIFKR
ncbi:hypothetical protein HCN44_008176 [Aphidius gifuensis]|uniref:Odorant receptor n=1 Tax=Aphidius gifuensis TaxID=684658 RepID=A0A834XMB4_APHGI|nr:hypothetical protein HCN44_008176 [Aphidius gifuensis]